MVLRPLLWGLLDAISVSPAACGGIRLAKLIMICFGYKTAASGRANMRPIKTGG